MNNTMIKLKTSWNLSLLFKNDNDPAMQKERKIIEEKCNEFIKKWKGRTDFLENPEILKQALDDYEEWSKYYTGGGGEWYYFHLKHEKDQNNTEIRAKNTQTQNFALKIGNKMQFFYLTLSKIKPEKQNKFLIDKRLKDYRHFLEKIFTESKHLLSDDEEKIMNLKSIPAYANWIRMTSAFISREEKKVLMENGKKSMQTLSDILSYINSPNKKVRDDCAKALNEILENHADVATEELNSILENKKIDDELRNFPGPDSLRLLNDDVDTAVVNTVIDSVSKRFDISSKHYELKAKLLGLKKLKYHERNVPYGKEGEKYSFEQAVDLVTRVFTNLDKSFADIFLGFIENGQIDVFPKKGKRSGAFCAHHLLSKPTYILLNYTNKLEDVLTIAHEMGHGINNELIRAKQNALNFETPTSTAEVASTFMEDFVLEEILKEADDELKLTIMIKRLDDSVSSIFRQIGCYKFELELHKTYREKGYLSKEEIGRIFQKNMKAYMGDYVEQSPGSENWWVYWQHIRYFFYVYSYAGGLLISKSLQSLVRKDPKNIEKVKEFLSAGTSESPKNIFMKLGIDITDKKFWEQGINEIEKLLDETTELAKKLKKIR